MSFLSSSVVFTAVLSMQQVLSVYPLRESTCPLGRKLLLCGTLRVFCSHRLFSYVRGSPFLPTLNNCSSFSCLGHSQPPNQWGPDTAVRFLFRTPAVSYTIQFLVISKSQGCAGSSLLSPSILFAVVSLAPSFSLLLYSLPSVAWNLCKAKFMVLAAAAQYLLPIDPRCCHSFVLCPSFSCLMDQLLLSSPGFQGYYSSEGDTPDSP